MPNLGPTIVTGTSVSSAWEISVSNLLKNGHWVPTERGQQAIEGVNYIIHVPQVIHPIEITSLYQFSKNFVGDYQASLEDQFKGISIASRLYKYGEVEVNQFLEAVDKLRNYKTTRRSVISLWDPKIDNQVDHPPCNVLHQFLLRDEHLCLSSFFRSNDAWLASLPDMVSNCMLLKHVGDEVGAKFLCYTHIAGSYHIYESDFLQASNRFNENSIRGK